MPITPYSTPIATEYKPLGLEAFAQPLSQMQEKFDITKQAVEDADFEINRLDKDDPRSAELIKTLTEKRDELAENLATTKNYRQAAQKLSSLNKTFNKDPELQAIRNNYTSFKEADAEQKKRIDGKSFTQRDYDEWKFKAMHEFKGTNYDKSSDTYQSVNTHARMKNMEDDMREEALKLAGMAKEQGMEAITGMVQIDPFTKQQITQNLAYINKDQLADEIQNFLKTSDKYNDWTKEKADYEWYYNRNSSTGDGQDFNKRVIEGHLNNLDKKIELYKKNIDSKDISPEDKKQYTETVKYLEKQKNDTLGQYQKENSSGNLDNLSRQLYLENAQNNLGTLGYTAADIVDFTKQGIDTKNITDDFAKARATENVKKLKEQVPLSVNIVSNTDQVITSGSSTSAIDNQNEINAGRNTLEYLNNTPVSKIEKLEGLDLKLAPEAEIKEFNKTKENVKDLTVLQNNLTKHESKFDEYDIEIQTLLRTKNEGTAEEKKEKEARLTHIVQERAELNSTYQNELVPLQSIIERDIQGNEQMTNLWKDSNEDVKTFLNKLEDQSLLHLKASKSMELSKGSEEEAVKYATAKVNEEKLLLATKGPFLLTEEEQASYFDKYKQEYKEMIPTNIGKSNTVNFSEKLMSNYKNHLTANLTVAAPEIFLDESASKATMGATDRLLDYNLENQGGASKLERVQFNAITGEAKTMIGKEQSFNVDSYNPIPHYAGIDKNGQTVLRYVLKKEAQNNSTIASMIRKKYPDKYKSDETVPNDVIEAWRNDNPTNLYTVSPGVSINPAKEAEVNYTELGTTALQVNDSVGYKTNIQNFANLHLLGNAERREGYLEMSARLTKALQENIKNGTHSSTTINQAPASWQTLPDGTSKGFQITYTIDEGQVFAKVQEVIVKPGKDPVYNHVSYSSVPNDGNLTTQLVAMDLTYGTGREQDLVKKSDGWGPQVDFVPAFTNPMLFKDGLK